MEFQTPSSASDENPPKEDLNLQFHSPQSSSSSSSTSSSGVNIRLWRPAAQRNLRNQWSKLASLQHDWLSSSSAGRSHATALVNSHLSEMYMDAMELGVLSDMPGIRKKASLKLFKQQEIQRNKLLSSYKDMVCTLEIDWFCASCCVFNSRFPLVGVVTQMVNTSRSMRCYLKGTANSPIAQFSFFGENQNDAGDGGGVPVFTFWPISIFEKVAEDFVQMFISELNLKRLLLMELLSIGDERISKMNSLHWSEELYLGEFEDLHTCNLYSKEDGKPVFPSHRRGKVEIPYLRTGHQQDRDVLQIYLTTWIAEVNIERSRVDEILAIIGAEMHIPLS